MDRDFGSETEEQAAASRAAIAAATEARETAEAAAVAKAAADALAAEDAELEQRVKAHFVGSPEQWAQEKDGLLRAERQRMTEARAADARAANQMRYSG
jgi:hypothetical protein